ncbi:hypothetical protein, partial [uncultured Microbacterium sp.]|uniref:hypothetical protein n=1 Tax=uncultured Microbacterium sp. TaxID=191216 RepID=UPI0028E7BB48
ALPFGQASPRSTVLLTVPREFRTVAPREAEPWERPLTADAAAVARLSRDLARDAVMPGALGVACSEHDAEAGAYCYRGARGVCAARIGLSRYA